MEGQRFDQMAKAMANGATRRGVLRGLAGGAAAGALALRGAGRVAADDDCKPVGKKCKKDAQCCSRVCDRATGTCADPNACPTYSRCEPVCGPAGCQHEPQIVTCGAEPGCSCLWTADGTIACVRDPTSFSNCENSSECGCGEVCAYGACQLGGSVGYCASLCGQGG